MVHLDCPKCGSSQTGQILVTDDQIDILRKGPDGDVFKSGLPVYHCSDCESLFPLYVPKDLLERDLDFDDLLSIALSIRESKDPRDLRISDVDLTFMAETAHNEGDEVLAVEYMRLVLMSHTGDEGLEDAMDAMMDDGDVTNKLELGRWLLKTLSQFEVVPSGIWDVYQDATTLHERGDDEAATALMDRLIRTADDRLIGKWKELRKHIKSEYKSSKKYLDKGSRKPVKELINKASALMAADLTLLGRRALRLIREAHEIIDSI